jgi:mono/diheme cytochrome c family protein
MINPGAMKRYGTLGVLALIAAAASLAFSREPGPDNEDRAARTRGEYLARAGDCAACHTERGGEPYAGGLPIPTPFGIFYGPNITPDAETGIGQWTAEDFWRALHEGRSKDGTLLYPAFPYTNYTLVTRADSDDLFTYLRSLPAVRKPRREHELKFPYNERKLLIAWRALYFHPGEYEADSAQDADWNRGAYLVRGLGHCDACHSARNMLGAVPNKTEISGGLIPVLNWYAPPLTSNRETALGNRAVDELIELLQTGVSKRGAVFGPMATVVKDSLQHLTRADLRAMVMYLKSQAQEEEPAMPGHFKVSAAQGAALAKQGAKLYDKHCANCHQRGGEGVPRIYPPLNSNESILMSHPINGIRMVVNGGFPPSTQANPRPYGMPPFSQDLSDVEIAAVLTFIRQSWGNRAPAVSPAAVTSARGIPVD